MRAPLSTTLILLAGAVPASAQSGALELFVGETLFVGGTRASVTWLHVEGDNLATEGSNVPNPDGLGRDRDVYVASWNTNLRRGLDVALVLPWHVNDATFTSPSGVLSSDEGGLGDLALVFKQRTYNDVWDRGAWNVSVLGGIELPTGETSNTTNGQLDPAACSRDPALGTRSSRSPARGNRAASAPTPNCSSRPSVRGDQDYEAGNLFSAEVDIGYRVLMTQYPGPTVSAKTGLRWRGRGRARQAGSALINSGGDELAVVGSVGWHPVPAWDVSLKVEIPVYEDLNGTQIETDYRALFGLGLRF